MEGVKEKIAALIETFVTEQGFDLVDISINHYRQNDSVQVLVDKPQGGITIDECANLSRQIDVLLEAQNIFDGSYTLEVSSPGIDRPLVHSKDFIRAKGKEVVFYLKEPVQGSLEYTGIILRVEEGKVHLQAKGKEVSIALQLINKAKHVF